PPARVLIQRCGLAGGAQRQQSVHSTVEHVRDEPLDRGFVDLPLACHRRDERDEHAGQLIDFQSRTDDVIRLRSLPTFSTSVSIKSPGFKNSGGVRAKPTPSGVPVAMIAPGSSVMPMDAHSITASTG